MISFEPMSASTVNIAVSTSTQSVLIANFSGANQVRVMNDSSGTVWVAFGGSGVNASATADIPIPAGAVEVLSAGSAASTLYAAAICPSGTGKVYFTPGAGI